MKRLFRVFVCIITALTLSVMCMGLFACKKEDIRQAEVKVSVYDTANSEFKTLTMTVDLYRHLAPKTCDAIIKYIKEGYYNNTLVYKFASAYNNQIMVGDYLYSEGKVIKNAVKPQIEGEFTYGGTQGSNLVNKKGSVGLWRSYYACDTTDMYKTSSVAMNSGRSTWYMPDNNAITSYDGYFCVFAQIDTSVSANETALSLMKELFNYSSYYTTYEVYYTGTYDKTKADEDFGLTFHVVESADFNEEEIEDLFVAEGQQLVSYNHHSIKVPNVDENNKCYAEIVSVKMK